MKRSYWLILIMNYMATGVMVPVLSLAFIEKGCTLATLSLILGLYSLSVFILELPSGVLADLIGRKRVFIISCIFGLSATILMLFTHSIILLVPVVILLGAGRAFASGSVDALIIEGYVEKHGVDKMHSVSSGLALCETAGLSVGSILGGFLPVIAAGLHFRGAYDLNILTRIILCAGLTILSVAVLKEKPSAEKNSVNLKQYLRQGYTFLKSSRVVLLIAFGMLCSGLFLFIVEAYWQPVYTTLLPDKNLSWTLGFISFGCFLFAGVGNLAIKRLLTSRPRLLYAGYMAARILVFAALFVFSLQNAFIAFGASLFIMYFFFGGANVAESTILIKQIPDNQRAGMLSFASFIFQAGGMIAPALSPVASTQGGIKLLWSFIAVLFLAFSVIIGFALKSSAKNEAKGTLTEDTLNPEL